MSKTPLLDGLKRYAKKRVVAFDVPGHKQGKGDKTLIDVFGAQSIQYDLIRRFISITWVILVGLFMKLISWLQKHSMRSMPSSW